MCACVHACVSVCVCVCACVRVCVCACVADDVPRLTLLHPLGKGHLLSGSVVHHSLPVKSQCEHVRYIRGSLD